jgi:hypothetical protein
MKSASLRIISIALLSSTISMESMEPQAQSLIYHWRADLESVKALEILLDVFKSDSPYEIKHNQMLHQVFIENDSRQTVLSHALRGKYAEEFVKFLKEKGAIDPISSGIAPAFGRHTKIESSIKSEPN